MSWKSILERIADRFLQGGVRDLTHPWWWERLKNESHGFAPYDAVLAVSELLDDQESYWFIASEEHAGKKWLCEANRAGIAELLANMYYFEYYIVHKKLHWLLGENHHGVLFATGEAMPDKLQRWEHDNPTRQASPGRPTLT